jgi:hypothetical protein
MLQWILSGDPAIQYKIRKELLMENSVELENLYQSLPYVDGYIKRYLELRDERSGMWGNGIYTPKWTSTHYTLLELKNMNCPWNCQPYRASAILLLDCLWKPNGLVSKGKYVDFCVAAMIGSIVSHCRLKDTRMNEIMDYMLNHIQKDGGFNCSWQRSEVSSVHTTLTVLQFFLDYERNGYQYRLQEIEEALLPAEETLLKRELYKRKSDGKPVQTISVNMPYPTRYKYDFLKSLEYFVDRERPYDKRMESAINLLLSKQLKSGAWSSTGNHPGQIHFKIEDEGRENRMNTVRALKVVNAYRPELFSGY